MCVHVKPIIPWIEVNCWSRKVLNILWCNICLVASNLAMELGSFHSCSTWDGWYGKSNMLFLERCRVFALFGGIMWWGGRGGVEATDFICDSTVETSIY